MAVLAAPQVAGQQVGQQRGWRIIAAIPDLLASAFAGFAAPAIVLLLLGRFSPAWVLPLGLAGAAIAVAICGLGSGHVDRRVAQYTLAAIGIAVVWFVVNSFFSAENLFARRDPATYDLAARWLMDHSRALIPTHPEVFGSPPGYNDSAAGFRHASPTELYAQGNHLLPALLAVVGWIFGTTAMLKANVAFGAVALVVFFGLARRVVSGPFALLAMVVLAVSMPLVFVSRDTYSEPLALMLLMGGVALLHRAIESNRIRDFALAGFIAGTAASCRIDTYPSLLAIILAAMLLLVFAAPAARRARIHRIAALLGGMAAPTLLGWLDVSQLASGYYHDELHHIGPVMLVGLALLLLLPVVSAVAWRPAVRRRLEAPALPNRAILAFGVLIAAAAVFLVTRPLWLEGRGPFLQLLTSAQRQAGLTPDGTRSYSEQSVRWIAMYVGWPTVVLATVGYFLLLRRAIRDRSLSMVGMLAMGLGMTTLYLMSPQITPDQPWAMRRYVPVVMPILLIAAAYTICVLWRQRNTWLRGTGVAGVLAMLVVPIVVTAPASGVREGVPQLAQVSRICASVSPDGAVITVDGASKASYSQTLRSYCNVPTTGLIAATAVQLAQVQQSVAAHGRVLYVMSDNGAWIHWASGHAPDTAFSEIRMSRWPNALNEAPNGASHETVAVYLGTVRADGLAEPVVRPPG